MIADFLEPLWESLFDKLGVFGLLIATLAPFLMIAALAGLVILIIKLYTCIRLPAIAKKAAACEQDNRWEDAWKYYCQYYKKRNATAEEAYRMGKLCLKGIKARWNCTGITADPTYWLKKAHSLGHPDAAYDLGCLYNLGRGCKMSLEEAIVWYEKAASYGNEIAEYLLSVCYEALAKECAKKNNLHTSYLRASHPQWRKYTEESLSWKISALEHGYREP